MIRKIIQRVNEWLEDRLRSLVRPLSPDARVIVIVTMLIVFSGLSIYMTVSSIYNLGKDKGRTNADRTDRNPKTATETAAEG
ncbi:TraL conjugative transposon family protein [Parabacteroides sp. OttesenSCG-928-N08]|nr:TraL conjugative transposon family protein [Parabacteroides sp. OttesenSCG-928-N08]